MRASVYERYGPPEVLSIRDVRAPKAKAGRVRVEVHAAALNPKDMLLRKGKLRWLAWAAAPFPRIPGYDVAGRLLDETGDLPVGSAVFGMIQAHSGGACAEVAALRPGELTRMPAGLSMPEAAALPLVSLTALQALRDELELKPGQHLLINGASGGVGTMAVQIAKVLGARVTAVCSGRNADLVTELGADRVVDYTREDLHAVRDLDRIFDVYGNLEWPQAQPMLRTGGRFCTTVPSAGAIGRGALHRLGLHRAALVVVQSRKDDLEQIRRWVEDGAIRPVVDRVFPLEQAAEAHAYLDTRRARGKVVLTLR